MSEQNLIVAGNLSENVIYVYRLGAANSVGTVWSDISWEICKLPFVCALSEQVSHEGLAHIAIVLVYSNKSYSFMSLCSMLDINYWYTI